MFIQRKKERQQPELPGVLLVDYMNERETLRQTGSSVRSALGLPEATKNAESASLPLTAAKNGEKLSLSELPFNLRSLIEALA